MIDNDKLVALAHAQDAASLQAEFERADFGRYLVQTGALKTDEWQKERTKMLSPGTAPFLRRMEIFEEVLANYGYAVVKVQA